MLLPGDGAGQRVDRARELDQRPITEELDDTALNY
jgi:hypothetical protein